MSARDEHAWARRRLAAFRIGLLTESENQRIEAHVSACETCRGVLDEIDSREILANADAHIPTFMIATWSEQASPRGVRGLERQLLRNHLQTCASCQEDLREAGHAPELPLVAELGDVPGASPQPVRPAAPVTARPRRASARITSMFDALRWQHVGLAAAAIILVVLGVRLIRNGSTVVAPPPHEPDVVTPAEPSPPREPPAEPSPQQPTPHAGEPAEPAPPEPKPGAGEPKPLPGGEAPVELAMVSFEIQPATRSVELGAAVRVAGGEHVLLKLTLPGMIVEDSTQANQIVTGEFVGPRKLTYAVFEQLQFGTIAKPGAVIEGKATRPLVNGTYQLYFVLPDGDRLPCGAPRVLEVEAP